MDDTISRASDFTKYANSVNILSLWFTSFSGSPHSPTTPMVRTRLSKHTIRTLIAKHKFFLSMPRMRMPRMFRSSNMFRPRFSSYAQTSNGEKDIFVN
ncbi:hypothetical protein PanWU01x14_115150 [Parasponia andersonii]|uniref:Uncharacterized protein n=1 Tax=Parasponia andersonii TaxID=3476 RepID=A0A2P5CXJ3_PARAD|nr:hypothetical protein PanWU01x14_115150 [Parasponia andersonii]